MTGTLTLVFFVAGQVPVGLNCIKTKLMPGKQRRASRAHITWILIQLGYCVQDSCDTLTYEFNLIQLSYCV